MLLLLIKVTLHTTLLEYRSLLCVESLCEQNYQHISQVSQVALLALFQHASIAHCTISDVILAASITHITVLGSLAFIGWWERAFLVDALDALRAIWDVGMAAGIASALCSVGLAFKGTRVHCVQAVVIRPNVHHAAIRTQCGCRKHRSAGGKGPLLAAVCRVHCVQAVVPRPNVHHAAIRTQCG